MLKPILISIGFNIFFVSVRKWVLFFLDNTEKSHLYIFFNGGDRKRAKVLLK